MEKQAKERPIRFRDWEVRAILDGRKTQMRLVVKFDDSKYDAPLPHVDYARDGMPIWSSSPMPDNIRESDYFDNGFPCPLGTVGDRLWVREAFALLTDSPHPIGVMQPFHYLADITDRRQIEDYTGRPSIHMPRWASRITLEITGVRVERLQDISEEDAVAEGAQCAGVPASLTNRGAFAKLWQSIYGPESWAASPWVWCIEFKKV